MNPYPTDDNELLAEMYEADCERYDKRKAMEVLMELHDKGHIATAHLWDRIKEEGLADDLPPATKPTPKPAPKPLMSAARVMKGLAQDPKLLFDVACLMGATTLAILGPWSEQEGPVCDPQGRITRINWVRRFDTQGKAVSFICISFHKDDHGREVLNKIEWQVYIKQTDPDRPHIVSHHAKGETYTVMEAQRAADEAAVERGWMLVD